MKTYKSKIDYLFLILPISFPILVLIKQIQIGDLHIILPTIIGILVIYSLLYNYTNYTIDRFSLNIKGGLFINENIQISSITNISRNRNIFRRSLLTNPILTNRCLEIKYENNKSILVSPNDINQFVNDIQQINPNVSVDLT